MDTKELPHGVKILHDPLRNKGTAFTESERDALNLRGLLPPRVHSAEEQLAVNDPDLERIERRFWIEKALTSLGERDQALIYSLYLDPSSPTYEEIAAKLEMPVSSIGPTRARALQKLKAAMEERDK